MLRKFIFWVTVSLKNPLIYFKYKKIKESNYQTVIRENNIRLVKFLSYVSKNVPFYNKYKDVIKNIHSVNDIHLLPFTNKNLLNKEELLNKNIDKIKKFKISTGGTTGTPFNFYITKKDTRIATLKAFKGYSMAGWEPGDSMLILGGESIVGKINKKKRIVNYLLNFYFISSFDLSENKLEKILDFINKNGIKFIRGYATTIYFLAKWMLENNKKLRKYPKGIITTAEKLYPEYRKVIESVFNCEVYDSYGLYDGGIDAFECKYHKGLHVFQEGSIIEVIDKRNKIIKEGYGKIYATSLFNICNPFIRYDTGDYVKISYKKCKCGWEGPTILEIEGRSTDILITPEKKPVHGWFFLYIFWTFNKGILQYHISQKTKKRLEIRLIVTKNFDKKILRKIEKKIHEKSPKWDINFKFVDKIVTKNKFKFISNEIGRSK